MPTPAQAELYALVKQIPSGMVASYGDLGRCLRNPVSGLIVGHWMSVDPEGTPWWRVTAKDGRLVVFKRDASFAIAQRKMLEDEGVAFFEEKVVVALHLWNPELAI